MNAAERAAREHRREDAITTAQRRLSPLPATPRTAEEYLRVARWWRLEAKRGHTSAAKSQEYATNMKWASERARLSGPGSWQELKRRAGEANVSTTPAADE